MAPFSLASTVTYSRGGCFSNPVACTTCPQWYWYSFYPPWMNGKLSELWSAQARIQTWSAKMQSTSDIHYTTHAPQKLRWKNSKIHEWHMAYCLSISLEQAFHFKVKPKILKYLGDNTYKSSFMSVDYNFKQWWTKLVKKRIHSWSLPKPPATLPLSNQCYYRNIWVTFYWQKPFLVSLVDQLLQIAPNLVKMAGNDSWKCCFCWFFLIWWVWSQSLEKLPGNDLFQEL